MAKTVVIYYSRKGENYVNGRIENLMKGNTEIVVEFIKKAVDELGRPDPCQNAPHGSGRPRPFAVPGQE